MGGCQNYGPFLGTLNIRCRIILRTQKGTVILTTTHISYDERGTAGRPKISPWDHGAKLKALPLRGGTGNNSSIRRKPFRSDIRICLILFYFLPPAWLSSFIV